MHGLFGCIGCRWNISWTFGSLLTRHCRQRELPLLTRSASQNGEVWLKALHCFNCKWKQTKTNRGDKWMVRSFNWSAEIILYNIVIGIHHIWLMLTVKDGYLYLSCILIETKFRIFEIYIMHIFMTKCNYWNLLYLSFVLNIDRIFDVNVNYLTRNLSWF